MRVGELVGQLSDIDPNLVVVLARDEEGNNFHVLYEVAEYDVDDSEDILEDTHAEAYAGQQVVVLWP